ncbi:hypothetical protein [Paenibacillus sp. IITD108]|uniref:hypothetical protein n=1 Tax=Paenibacillus sp. IITD108 TaxID=3116649 RepID=UPI002F40E7DB
MRQIAFFEHESESGSLIPSWIVLDRIRLDWSNTLYINLHTPFELLTLESFDVDISSISIPDFAYVRNPYEPASFGIHMPTLANFIESQTYANPNDLEIERLVMRISDIEDCLQYTIQNYLEWNN